MNKIYKRVNGEWISIDEENRIVDFVCYVGDNATLTIKRNTDGVTDTAYLDGDGATKDYTEDEVKPWAEFIPVITAIHIGAGVTSLGDYLFSEHTSVKQLTFEDSSTITHLGDRCFWRCQFGGEFAFPGLADSTMSRAFAVCVNLEAIKLSDRVTAIGDKAFNNCINLRSVTGLGNVTSVGVGAFLYTHKLTCIDLSPSACETIGDSAFFESPALSHINTAEWNDVTFGYNASASSNFTEDELQAARAIKLPSINLWQTGFDAVYKYGEAAGEEFIFSSWDTGSSGIYQRYLDTRCHTASMSAVFGILKGKKYNSIGEFWIKEVYTKNPNIGQNDDDESQELVLEILGLQLKNEVYARDGLASLKTAIAAELQSGNPMICNMWFDASYGHAVAIVGANAATDKLVVADSIKTSGTRGIVYEVALEDLIGINAQAHVESYEVMNKEELQ